MISRYLGMDKNMRIRIGVGENPGKDLTCSTPVFSLAEV